MEFVEIEDAANAYLHFASDKSINGRLFQSELLRVLHVRYCVFI